MTTPIPQLEKWYIKNQRNLPWRGLSSQNPDTPYRIWISEIMLQQTQVSTVIPYYERFLRKFPNLTSLARSTEEEVLKLWAGLGYYSRARNLRKGSQYLAQHYAGKFPKERELLLEVPGIGPYTAGAILSIAYNLPIPLVDGNVERVLARFYGLKKPIPQLKKIFWEKATEWVSLAHSPRVLNQAMMELGATLCTKHSPQCFRCPIQKNCLAFQKNLQNTLPLKKKRLPTKHLYWVGLIYQQNEKILLKENKQGPWWKGLWEFPRLEMSSLEELQNTLLKIPGKRLQSTQHQVTHHRIHFHPVLLSKNPKNIQKNWKGTWVSKEQTDKIPLSTLTQKTFQIAFTTEDHTPRS